MDHEILEFFEHINLNPYLQFSTIKDYDELLNYYSNGTVSKVDNNYFVKTKVDLNKKDLPLNLSKNKSFIEKFNNNIVKLFDNEEIEFIENLLYSNDFSVDNSLEVDIKVYFDYLTNLLKEINIEIKTYISYKNTNSFIKLKIKKCFNSNFKNVFFIEIISSLPHHNQNYFSCDLENIKEFNILGFIVDKDYSIDKKYTEQILSVLLDISAIISYN